MRTGAFDKLFIKLAFLYIALPAAIFILGWMKWQFSIPISLLLLFSFYLSVKEEDSFQTSTFSIQKKHLYYILPIITIWMLLSGIGNFSYQNEDHQFRNALFSDIVNHNWPVTYNVSEKAKVKILAGQHTMLTYYIGFWLPAAALAKVFGLAAGRVFLFLWALAGVLLLIYFVFRYLNKTSLPILLIVLFVGNLYWVVSLKYFPAKFVFEHDYAPWSDDMLLFDNLTAGVYWVFNQCIASLLAFMLIVNRISHKNLIFIYIFAMFLGPFPFVGMAPFVLYSIFSDHSFKTDSFISLIKKYISIQNIFGVAVFLPIMYMYFSGNAAAQHTKIVYSHFSKSVFLLLVSYGLVAMMIFPKYKREPLYYIILIVMTIVPFIQLGSGQDFGDRVSMPSMFLLAIFIAKFLTDEGNRKLKILVTVYVCLAAVDPLMQVARSAVYTLWYKTDRLAASKYLYNRAGIYELRKTMAGPPENNPEINYLQQDDLKVIDNPQVQAMANFMSITDKSMFYKYLAKHD